MFQSSLDHTVQRRLTGPDGIRKQRGYARHVMVLAFLSVASSLYIANAEVPLCRVLSGKEGGPAIVIDDMVFSPIFFAVNNQFGRDDVLVSEIKQAGNAGIDLISFNIPLDWAGTGQGILDTIDTFCSANPNAYYYVRVWVGGNPQWLEKHPEAAIVLHDGTRVPWSSPASTVWRDEADRLLRDRIKEIMEGPHGDRFIGVHPANMQTGEWFYYHANESLDYSDANKAAFRAWLAVHYRSERRLQEAWGNPGITFESAEIPKPAVMEATDLGPFRHPVDHRAAADAQRFQSDLVADTIAHFARVVKDATNGRSLVGAFYGYTFELNHNGPQVLAQSGHLSLGRLLACPDVDMIHAPYAYFERGLGQPGHFHLPLDSIAMHGKLAVLEEDSYTHLASDPPPGITAPGVHVRTRTLDETLSLNRRNYANFLTHKAGFWYFDLLSDGRWHDEEFWKTAPLLRRMAATARDEPVYEPEVAFVVDEESVHALASNTRPYLLQSIGNWRHELARLGTTVGYYLQSDLVTLPDSVKVVLLANPYTIDDDANRALRPILRRGGTVIWTFAPGVAETRELDLSRVEALTGIETTTMERSGPFSIFSTVTDERVQFEHDWQPRLRIEESGNMQILARYEGAEEAAAAARPMGDGASVYSAVPRLPVGLLRWICRNSGVHFYRESPGMTGVVGPYLIVHTSSAITERFRWPEPATTIDRLIPYSPLPIATDTQVWRDDLPANTTVIYRVTE